MNSYILHHVNQSQKTFQISESESKHFTDPECLNQTFKPVVSIVVTSSFAKAAVKEMAGK